MTTPNDAMCYACGPQNPVGLHLRFVSGPDGSVSAAFTPRMEHQGYRGIVHGGFLALVLDEAIVASVHCAGLHAVSSELTVRLLKPVSPGDTLDVTASVSAQAGHRVTAAATARRRADGVLVARATAACVQAPHGSGTHGHAPVYPA